MPGKKDKDYTKLGGWLLLFDEYMKKAIFTIKPQLTEIKL